MAPSPPKPWERAGTAPSAASSSLTTSTPSPAATASTPAAASAIAPASSTAAGAPALPDRPAGMGAAGTTAYGANTSALGTSPYSSPYGATTSAYSSPYSRFGSSMYGGGYGSGYGGYGSSMYGGYGSSMYGGGMYGSGMYGAGGMYGGGGMMGMGPGGMYGPGAEMSLSQRMEAGTAATFQVLQSLVGAVGGFAQMLESTFMATHSSFFAMIGVAEQFGHLRNYLGQVLSIFALLRWCKALLYRLVGKTPPGESISADGFRAFEAAGGAAGGPNGAAGGPAKPKLSKRPLIVFFLTVVGLPWLMNRLVRLITARQEAEAMRLGAAGGPVQFDAQGRPIPPPPGAAGAAPLDPSQLTFTRALFAYAPPAENADKELAFAKDDIIAVLAPSREERAAQAKADKIEGANGAGTWWMGRKRDGTTGWFPSTYVQELPLNGAAGAAAEGKEEVKA
ncbi:hypothetical protein JCM10207_002549 [Rhodosporidiobolus poonsookiae]